MEKLRICCLAPNAYPVIEPTARGYVGGTETRAWLLARELARQDDLKVSIIVRWPRRLARYEYDGVRIVRPRELVFWARQFVATGLDVLPAFPWLRIRRWSFGLVWRLALLAALRPLPRTFSDSQQRKRFFQLLGADVFCCFGAHRDSAMLIDVAKACGRKSVLFLCTNSDLDERYARGSTYRTPFGERGDICWQALCRADQIVAQTAWQQQALRDRFGREAVVIRNPIDVSEWQRLVEAEEDLLPETQGLHRYALWIGRADAFHKRPLECLELARRCPEVDFLMILNRYDDELQRRVTDQRPPNVRITARVDFARMPQIFRKAVVFVSTSSAAFEGFPNVFLQAAAAGVPIASLEIDYGFVESERCGCAAQGDLDRLADYVRAVWQDSAQCEADGARAREYVRRYHDLPQIATQLAALLRDVAAGQ